MVCEIVKTPTGPVIMCSRKRVSKPRLCSACQKYQASRECDYPVMRTKIEGGHQHRRQETCDKPLCSKCAKPAGDNIDYCPHHPSLTAAMEF